MREEFKENSSTDFRQRYQGTFGWYEKDSGDKHLVCLTKVAENVCHYIDETGLKFTANADKGNYFSFLPVERGCYNYQDNDVVICKRIPARQWKRGICAENTSIKSLATGEDLQITFKTIGHIFGAAPDDRPFQKYMATLTGNVALDTTFSIVNGSVYLYDFKIGEVKRDEIVLNDKLFKQEVDDLIRAKSLPFITTIAPEKPKPVVVKKYRYATREEITVANLNAGNIRRLEGTAAHRGGVVNLGFQWIGE